MKTSVYVAVVAIILMGLGLALVPLFKDKRNTLPAATALAAHNSGSGINWGEGSDAYGQVRETSSGSSAVQ